jgi:hypothetical protein
VFSWRLIGEDFLFRSEKKGGISSVARGRYWVSSWAGRVLHLQLRVVYWMLRFDPFPSRGDLGWAHPLADHISGAAYLIGWPCSSFPEVVYLSWSCVEGIRGDCCWLLSIG